MTAVEEFIAALRAEFAKFRSLRGLRIALLLFAVITVGLAAVEGLSLRQAIAAHSSRLAPDFTPQQAGFDAALYGQVALIAVGALAVAGEYGSGMIRLSLLAVPRRGVFLAAKMTALTVVATVAAVPVAVGGYAMTQAALGKYGASFRDAGVPRALVGVVAYLVLITLLSAGVAGIARNTIAPLAILIPLVLVGSHLLTLVAKAVARFAPDQAGEQMLAVHVKAGDMSPAAGFAVLLAWVAAVLLICHAVTRRRDV